MRRTRRDSYRPPMTELLTSANPLTAVDRLAPSITAARQQAAADRRLPDTLVRALA